jgi:hypothetical protein
MGHVGPVANGGLAPASCSSLWVFSLPSKASIDAYRYGNVLDKSARSVAGMISDFLPTRWLFAQSLR